MFNKYLVLRSTRPILSGLVLVMMGLLFSRPLAAQTAQLDVDRLYEKYKGRTETTIFAGDKEINAHVLISYNGNNLPYRIVVYGEATADADMEELVDQLCEAKVKAGYQKAVRATPVNFDQYGMYENNIPVRSYQKGSQYAKYGIKKMEFRNQTQADSVTESTNLRHTSDFFYFEVGDANRKRTLKPEKFNF
jgi:hypothetical protein